MFTVDCAVFLLQAPSLLALNEDSDDDGDGAKKSKRKAKANERVDALIWDDIYAWLPLIFINTCERHAAIGYLL